MNEALFRQIRNHLYGSGPAVASTDGLITELKKACTTKYKDSPETISGEHEEIAYLYLLYKKKHEEKKDEKADFSDEALDTEILLTVTAPVIRFFCDLLAQVPPTDPEPTTKVDGMKVEDIAHFFVNYTSPSDKSESVQNFHRQICVDLPRLCIKNIHPDTYSLISAVAVEGKNLKCLAADQASSQILRFAQLAEAAQTLKKDEFDASSLQKETQADLIVLLTEFTNDEELIKMEIPDQGERLTSEQLIETLLKHADVNSLINLISITFSPKESGQKTRPETATPTEVDRANANHIDNNKVIQSWIEGHKKDIAYVFKPFVANAMTQSISIEMGILSLRTNFGKVLLTPSLGWDIKFILYKLVQEIINGPKCKENTLDTFKKIIALMILAGQTVRHTQKPATIASIRAYRETQHASKNPGDMEAVIRETISTVPEIVYACPAEQIGKYRKEYKTAIDMLSADSDEDGAPDTGRRPSFFERCTELYYKSLRQIKTQAATKIQRVVRGRDGRKKAKAAEKRLRIENALERLWPSAETFPGSGRFPFCLLLEDINVAEKAAKSKAAAEAEAATKIQRVVRGRGGRKAAAEEKAKAEAAKAARLETVVKIAQTTSTLAVLAIVSANLVGRARPISASVLIKGTTFVTLACFGLTQISNTNSWIPRFFPSASSSQEKTGGSPTPTSSPSSLKK